MSGNDLSSLCLLQTHVMKMDPEDKSLSLSPVQKVADTLLLFFTLLFSLCELLFWFWLFVQNSYYFFLLTACL